MNQNLKYLKYFTEAEDTLFSGSLEITAAAVQQHVCGYEVQKC